MQLDSHRRQSSLTMPCQWMSRRCEARQKKMADLTAPDASNPDIEPWKAIRRYNLRMMRKQVRHVVLMMALIEALRVGPIPIVYAGKHGYPAPAETDFGVWSAPNCAACCGLTERSIDRLHHGLFPQLALCLSVHDHLCTILPGRSDSVAHLIQVLTNLISGGLRRSFPIPQRIPPILLPA